MLIKLFIAMIVSFLFSAVIGNSLKNIFLKRGKFLAKGVPLAGGSGIWLGFMFSAIPLLLVLGSLSKQVIGIFLASSLMFILGIWDDYKEMSVPAKFFAQSVATLLLVFFDIRTHIVFLPDSLNILVTFIWVLGITNAFNHLDVMDGVAGLIALVVSLGFGIVVWLNGDIRSLAIFLVISGALCGFLINNLPPAKLYLGNSGSHFLGFILAAMALLVSYASRNREVALFTPLLILGFPIFDTAFLMLVRLMKKKSVFLKSDDHLALRFLMIGHSKVKALFIMVVLALVFVLCGLGVYKSSNHWGIVTTVFAVISTAVLIRKAAGVRVND